MKGFQNTILVIVVLVVSAQLAHFTYIKFFYPHESVLDADLDTTIRAATSLEDLLEQFERSESEVKEYEDSLPPEEGRRSFRRDKEPYQTNIKLKNAIRDWERKQEQIQRLLFQWTFGLLISLAGIGIHLKRIPWVGTALIVAGLAEMIWWSSPSISLGGAMGEFERLLNIKLTLSLVTVVVFAGVWVAWRKVD